MKNLELERLAVTFSRMGRISYLMRLRIIVQWQRSVRMKLREGTSRCSNSIISDHSGCGAMNFDFWININHTLFFQSFCDLIHDYFQINYQ